jgi:hypothetical protein
MNPRIQRFQTLQEVIGKNLHQDLTVLLKKQAKHKER